MIFLILFLFAYYIIIYLYILTGKNNDRSTFEESVYLKYQLLKEIYYFNYIMMKLIMNYQ